MLLIRAVEECLLALFSEGKLFGTTHTCIGQEACAVAVIGALDQQRDIVFSTHRCHGHLLAFGEDLLDPYGGAFRVSRGLWTRFPQRVRSTPISEAGLIGVSTGLSLRGLRPIAESGGRSDSRRTSPSSRTARYPRSPSKR